MKYELIKDSDVGVIIDSTPILRDIKDTFEVSFVLPCDGVFVALFCGANGVERKVFLRNGRVVIPKDILSKEQYVTLIVSLIDDEKVIHSWHCHPLKVSTFLQLRMGQREISAGLTDTQMLARIAELEKTHAAAQVEYNTLKVEYSKVSEYVNKSFQDLANVLNEREKRLASLQKQNEVTVGAYNEAIKVVNDLQRRVYELEKNYDPTIIK